MTLSAVFITDLSGKVIISRNYRGDIPLSISDKFKQILVDTDEGQLKPVIDIGDGLHFIFINHSNLYIAAVTKKNSNSLIVISFLYHLVQVMQEYFNELEQESIRDNFVLVYELLDEMMDFGYPQVTTGRVLKEFIMNESHRLAQDVLPPDNVTQQVNWRPNSIKHKRNEVFLDVVEKLNLLVSSTGQVLQSEILGSLMMKCYLSGMPELKLGLNDKVLFESRKRTVKGRAVEMDDIRFHQCVRLAKFENDRTIAFIPPDGEFELMSYRLDTQVRPLFFVQAQMKKHSRSRIEFAIRIRSNFKKTSSANNVDVCIPVPPDADSPQFKSTVGKVTYAPEIDSIVWSIKQMPGKKEFSMKAQFGLPSITNDDDDAWAADKQKPPISLKFEIPYFTVSGIQVRYLKITEKSGYNALPWVRYITQNGDYQIRLA